MLIAIPDVLTMDEVANCRTALDAATWIDGRVTAGHQSVTTKNNRQIAEDDPLARRLGDMVTKALDRSLLFLSAALPQKVFPPLFNRYEGGEAFGTHVDNAVRQSKTTGLRIRTDLSATLFLSNPDDYDGGELIVEDTYGAHGVKLNAGHLILYPASSLHRVEPVTRGARVASFFWVQSMVRDDAQRALLFDLDMAIQQVGRDLGQGHASAVSLTGTYHNLLRMWAEV